MVVMAPLSGCATLHWPWHHKAPPPAAAGSDSDAAENVTATPQVIDPQVQRRTITVPKIKAKDFELGIYFGALSVEDFGTNPVSGVRGDFHVTEDFFFEGNYGRTTAGKTSFETLNGNLQLLTPAERRFTYYNVSLGYNLLPGEVYLGQNLAMNSSLYLLGGIGSTNFAGDQHFTVNFGAGYRILPTDWLAIHIDMQNLVFKSDLLGTSKLTSNLGASIGATVFF
jgi:outer membrane beta-barrel protein